MTHRCYGDWPGWWIEAGWCEEKGGYFFACMSTFDGNHETCWDYDWPGADLPATPDKIEAWLLAQAQTWPEVVPPPNFMEDLRGDEGCGGFNVSVHYDPTGQRFFKSSKRI